MLRGGMAHFEERHSPFQKTESRNCEIVSGPSETACKGKGCILQHPGAAVSLLLGLLLLEKEMATHSSVLAWRIPGTGEPGGLPSMGLHRVGHEVT